MHNVDTFVVYLYYVTLCKSIYLKMLVVLICETFETLVIYLLYISSQSISLIIPPNYGCIPLGRRIVLEEKPHETPRESELGVAVASLYSSWLFILRKSDFNLKENKI